MPSVHTTAGRAAADRRRAEASIITEVQDHARDELDRALRFYGLATKPHFNEALATDRTLWVECRLSCAEADRKLVYAVLDQEGWASDAERTSRDLRIDDHDDWYLPSRLELFVAWLGLRGTEQFESAWYWTSTQYAGDDECAWFQYFRNGDQDTSLKDYECRARAVRRVLIRSFDNLHISEAA